MPPQQQNVAPPNIAAPPPNFPMILSQLFPQGVQSPVAPQPDVSGAGDTAQKILQQQYQAGQVGAQQEQAANAAADAARSQYQALAAKYAAGANPATAANPTGMPSFGPQFAGQLERQGIPVKHPFLHNLFTILQGAAMLTRPGEAAIEGFYGPRAENWKARQQQLAGQIGNVLQSRGQSIEQQNVAGQQVWRPAYAAGGNERGVAELLRSSADYQKLNVDMQRNLFDLAKTWGTLGVEQQRNAIEQSAVQMREQVAEIQQRTGLTVAQIRAQALEDIGNAALTEKGLDRPVLSTIMDQVLGYLDFGPVAARNPAGAPAAAGITPIGGTPTGPAVQPQPPRQPQKPSALGGAPSLPRAPKNGAMLTDRSIAAAYLRAAGGDPKKAASLAAKNGWKF